jgi:hypothetical protein
MTSMRGTSPCIEKALRPVADSTLDGTLGAAFAFVTPAWTHAKETRKTPLVGGVVSCGLIGR